MPALSYISVRSIQDTLQNELNLPSRRPAKKPMLTDAIKQKRLKFAQDHLNWTVEE